MEYIFKKKQKLNTKRKVSQQKYSQLDYHIKLIDEYNVFKLLFMFIYFLGVKLCTFNVFHNISSYQHYDRSNYSFRFIIEYKHFTREYTFDLVIATFQADITI